VPGRRMAPALELPYCPTVRLLVNNRLRVPTLWS
jgi:hypothetical protein